MFIKNLDRSAEANKASFEEIAKEKEELAEFKKKKAEENQKAEQEAKAKKPENPETPEQKAEREEKEKICTTIYDYLKKIKINKDKDELFNKIKAEKEQINNLIKQLEVHIISTILQEYFLSFCTKFFPSPSQNPLA